MDGWLDAVAPAVWLAALVVLGIGMYRGLEALAEQQAVLKRILLDGRTPAP